MKMIAPYLKTRKASIIAAFAAIFFSTLAGVAVFLFTKLGLKGDFGAAGEVASVIPGFAGVLLAAYSLSAYMREEDEIVKLAEQAWISRNQFLLSSQYLYYSVSSDIGQGCSTKLTSLDSTRSSLIEISSELKSALLTSQLSRAIAQRAISNGEDGSSEIFSIRNFINSVDLFCKMNDDDACAFRDLEAEELELTEQAGNMTKKQLLDVEIHHLLSNWQKVLAALDLLDTPGKIEGLLRANYSSNLSSSVLELIEEQRGYWT